MTGVANTDGKVEIFASPAARIDNEYLRQCSFADGLLATLRRAAFFSRLTFSGAASQD